MSEEEIGKRRIDNGRANIGEQRQVLAQSQQACFGPYLVRHLVPLRPAHRPEDNGVRGLRLLHGSIGDRDFVRVIAASAHQRFFRAELIGTFFVEEVDDALHLGHDFGADAVTRKQKQVMGRHTLYLAENLLRGLLKPCSGLGNLPSIG